MKMTNRDWLNSLTDEEFASWICDGEAYDFKTNVYVQPSPKWNNLQYQYRYDDLKRSLLMWLKQERKNQKPNQTSDSSIDESSELKDKIAEWKEKDSPLIML